jgi:hypothetical protein
MTGLSVPVEWEPYDQVSPNGRFSSRTTRTHHGYSRKTFKAATESYLNRGNRWKRLALPERPALDISVNWSKGRNRQDLDNIVASCKGAIDGFADGAGFDDRTLIAITATQRHDPAERGFTVMSLREATPEEMERAGL